MREISGLVILSWLAACASEPPAPEVTLARALINEPVTFDTIPKLGTLTITAGTDTIPRTFVDFSVGAVDPSAWFEVQSGTPTLSLWALDPNDTDLSGTNSIRVRATFPTIGPGVSSSATLAAIGEDGATLAAAQDDLQVFVTSLVPVANTNFARATGTLIGTICRTGDTEADTQACVPLSGEFDTSVGVQN
ncbi:hypothetical protein [Yoonia sp. 208BN28-4]|uniref:hypothetical protein n=1 Tax=Yoonia sp. 208BN28-4 TaxID=3126505 RepID=UPI0030B6253B